MSAKRKPLEPPEREGFGRIQLPRYAELLKRPAWHYALHGGRNGTKSWTVAQHLLIEAAETSLRVGCAREIQETIAGSVKQLLDDQIERLGLQDYYESTKTDIRGKQNDSSFIFFGLWRNVEGRKSLEGLDRLWCEEANALSQRSIDIIIPTVRKEGSRIFWTWNPEFDHDPVDKMFRGPDGPPPKSIIIETGWQDNEWLSEKSRAEIEDLYRKNPRKARHVYGGDYVEAIEGAYYADHLAAVRKEGRIQPLNRDPSFELRAYWDIGRSDWTVVIICQFVGEVIRVLDFCAGQNQPPSYYMDWLREREWTRAQCWLPHDGDHIHADNPVSMSYKQQLKNAGFWADTLRGNGSGETNAARKRIDATKNVFHKIWFNDSPEVRQLMKMLGAYAEKIHEKTGIGLGPNHDDASHIGDAFGLMGIHYKPPKAVRPGANRGQPIGRQGTVA